MARESSGELVARLRDCEERHRLLQACVKDYAFFHLDPRGIITTWNEGARRLLGYAAEEAVGQPTALTFTAEDRRAGKPEAELRQARETGSASDDNWVVRKDGSRFWASGFTTALSDDQGGLRGYLKIFRDRTEQHEAEQALHRAKDELERRVAERSEELRQSQQRALQAERLAAIGQVIAALAHESGNALQRAQASLERLRWRLADRPDCLALIEEMQRAQDDLSRLYEDVRGYAAPVQLELAPCNLVEVARQAWARVVALHRDRDLHLQVEADCDPNAEADAFRLGQVYRNIFENAVAAGADPVVVTCRCGDTDLDGRPAVRVTIRDNGPGLSAEQRRQIFEPFYTTKTRGTGLGMAIARRVAEAHGGQIAVGAGPGAEILLTLPRSRP